MSNQDDWRKVMLTQYSIFGTVAGLEITALSIFASFIRTPLPLGEKIIFSITTAGLFIEIILILWLINQERKVAFNSDSMRSFMENESAYRITLILLMIITWGLLLSLLLIKIW